MRDDFHAVYTEGDNLRYPDAVRRRETILDDDGHAIRQARSCRDFSKGWREGRNSRDAVLGRYLRSQVGRPWDDVHSDICRALRGSPTRDRILESVVRWAVALHCHRDPSGTLRVTRHGRAVSGLYVCPEDGTLRETARVSQSGHRATLARLSHLTNPDKVELGDGSVLERTEGCWFRRGTLALDAPRHVTRQMSRIEVQRLGLDQWSGDAAELHSSIRGRRYDKEAALRQGKLLGSLIATFRSRDGNKPRRVNVSMEIDPEVEP